ncbi:class I SAM-dependent methyltransferase [Streptomyces sp. TRM70308]|uniref:class I SAM-dependent methyltransferase n=1 Tax=Streptomyces sp. TRM70308 TaxID=3131932 RepID=UPI003CFD7686
MSEAKLSQAARERSEIFDSSAGLYSATFPAIWRLVFRRLHPWMAEQFAGAARIVDAGTGPGYWARFLAQAEPRERVVGLDFSEKFLAVARNKYAAASTEYRLGDLTDTGFAAGSFDGVLCSGVLDTFPDPASALREFRRVLAPGGVVVLILRGPGGRSSRALEHFFRFCVGGMSAVKNRSVRSFRVPDHLWSRTPLRQRVATIAGEEGLAVREMRDEGLITKVTLVRAA